MRFSSYFPPFLCGAFFCAVLAAPEASAQSRRSLSSFAFYPAKTHRAEAEVVPDEVEVRLHATAKVRGLEFTIGDVASLVPSNTALAQQIAKIVVSKSPDPGYDQSVTDEVIRMAVRGKVSDMDQVKVAGAERCIVESASVKVAAELFLNAAQQHILRKLPWPAEEVELGATRKPQDRFVPIGKGDGPVLEITDVDGLASRGIARVRARVIVDNVAVYQTIMSFHIKTFQDVAVAAGHIRQGTILKPDDIKFERREISDFSFGFFADPAELHRMVSKRNIRAGQMLTLNELKEAPVVFAKSMVTIVYQTGKLSIKVEGRAEESGAPNEIIRVRNTSSNRPLWCKVVNGNIVLATNH